MRTRVAMIIIGLGIFVGPVLAKQPLADRLPADSVAYVGWAGKSLTFDGSMFGQLLADSSITESLGMFKTLIESQAPPHGREIFTPAWEIASIAWQHPIAIALTELKFEPKEVAQAVMLVDLGEDREKFDEQVAKILATLEDGPEITEKTVGNVTFKTVKLEDDDTISFGYIGNIFFFMVGPRGPEIIVELQPDKTLAADKKFVAAFKETGGENEQLSLYLDLVSITNAIEEHLTGGSATTAPAESDDKSKSKVAAFAETLGMDKATTLAGSIRIVDRHLYTKFKLFTPAPHRSILMPFAGSPLTDGDLAGVPADADVVAAVKLSPSALYKEIRRIVHEIEPRADAELAKAVSGIEKDLEMSIEKDLLAALGDTCVLSSAPSQGGFITGTVLSVTIKDKEKLSAAIAKIEAYAKERLPQGRRMRFSIETTKVDRTEIHYLSIASQRMPIPVSPAWAIRGDRFYFAFWPQVLETTFAREGTNPLVATEAFAKLRKKVSPNASCVMYLNMPSILKQLYPIQLFGGSAGMTALRGMMGNTTLPNLPLPLHKVEKYNSPEIFAVSPDKTGIIFESYSAQPSVGMVTPIGVAIALPALNSARLAANKTASKSNLRNIGTAIALYQADYEEMPEHLGLLVDDGCLSTKMFVSPLSGRKPPKFNKETKKLEGEIDYVYLKFEQFDGHRNPGDIILIYERPENHRNKGTLVTCLDFHVEWMDMERFKEALERSKKIAAGEDDDAEDF